MIFREAQTEDIKQIQLVRNAVKENVLSNPGLVTDKDCVEYLTLRGKGWVCETDGTIVGFAIADLFLHHCRSPTLKVSEIQLWSFAILLIP